HLYLDYEDGQWPEVHTVLFSPGTHDWEEKEIRVHPAQPVKSALVLLEFHQPGGAAWFDDISLTCGQDGGVNLLAASGFEDDDPAAAAAEAMSADYESRVQSLLEAVELAAGSDAPTDSLPAIEEPIEALVGSIAAKGVTPYFRRELRDLGEARGTLRLCAEISGTRASGERP
ncbi:MAG: hypothetical protein ACYC6Y_31135, partial [Thermoguttaceae bacterium]